MYNDKDFMDFVRYVSKKYKVHELDVCKVVIEEYDEQVRNSSMRRTVKNKKEILNDVLANCRLWLTEERKVITPIDLVSFRTAKLFFNLIEKRD